MKKIFCAPINLLLSLAIVAFCFMFLNPGSAKAYTGPIISLTKLAEMASSNEDLSSVRGVTITHNDDISRASLLNNCNNLEYLAISKATIDDMTFINNITSNNQIELSISMGYYNLYGVSSSYVKSLTIDSSYIENFHEGMNFSNIEQLLIISSSGYEDIDYTMYPKLKLLALEAIAISDYESFFEQLTTLEGLQALSLEASNIKDADTIYLKTLKNITSLNLEDTNITDVSFLAEMQQLTYLRPPIDTEDLSVIRNLPNLKTIYWSGYEQLAIDDELYQYIVDNNINHHKYDPTLKTTIKQMASQIKIPENATVKEKVEAVIDYVTDFVNSHDVFYDEEYSSNVLLYILHYQTGVCSHYSYLEHALLKEIGVQSYYIVGLIPVYMSELSGGFYSDDLKYELAGHAWLMAQDEQGIWYGWDPVQIDIYMYTDVVNNIFYKDTYQGKKYNFWKNPYEDDPYSFNDYQNGLYDTYNYNFAKRRTVTSKIGYSDYLSQKANEPLEFTINFETYGDNAIEPIVVEKGSKITEPETPTRTNYNFSGWYEDPDLSIKFNFEKMILKDTTLYAKWTYIEPVDPDPIEPPTPTTLPSMIEGQGQSYYALESTTGLTFKISGELSDFRDVFVDGSRIDGESYTMESGSTIVTLTSNYLKSLTSGIHSINFVYINGTATTYFRTINSNTISRTNFPDDYFYNCIINSYNNEYYYSKILLTVNDELTTEELNSITFLSCPSADNTNLTNLTGIEKLNNLMYLEIPMAKFAVQDADFSANQKLESIMLGEVAETIDTLDFSNSDNLKSLTIAFAKNLKMIVLSENNQLESLNITGRNIFGIGNGEDVVSNQIIVTLHKIPKLEKISDKEYALSLENFAFLKNGSSSFGYVYEQISNEQYIVGDCFSFDEENNRILIETTCLANGLGATTISHLYSSNETEYNNTFIIPFENPIATKHTLDDDTISSQDDIKATEGIGNTINTPDTGSNSRTNNGSSQIILSSVIGASIAILSSTTFCLYNRKKRTNK